MVDNSPYLFCSLLKDKPNFEFEFRDSLQFKNVPAPVKCYYLLNNTERDEQAASVVVTEEPEQHLYQFMVSRPTDTPPATPLLAGTLEYSPEPSTSSLTQFITSSMAEGASGCPMFGGVPDLNVIKPTPTSTPNPTPPNSRKSSQTDPTHPFEGSPPHTHVTPPSPSPLVTTAVLVNSPPHDSAPHPPLHPHSSFMANMRNTSMTPLTEDVNEEGGSTVPTADEGIDIPQRKVSDASSTGSGLEFTVPESSCSANMSDSYAPEPEPGTSTADSNNTSKPPTRKISDVSCHSGESGIESTTSKISDTSKDGLPEYKLSDSSKEGAPRAAADREVTPTKDELSPERQVDERRLSNSSTGSTEEELAFLRCRRAGSVSKAIEKYDTLTRQRKSGLPTVVQHPATAIATETQLNGEPEDKWNTTERSPSSSSTAVSSSM